MGSLFLAMLIDVSTLTAQLYLSGGTQNPFAFLYLLHVIISAVLLDAMSNWAMIFITGLCLAGLSVYSIPPGFPQDKASQAILYAQGMIICFVLNAGLLTIFITRIIQNLRTDEAQLADLRQRAAEEDHIVRMGLLASGAAHELGTPLATLSVILGDWQRMPEFGSSIEIQQEMHEMQTQLNRCKSIISDILLSAGEVRSESSAKTTLNTFLNELANEWRNSRTIKTFIVDNRIEHDIPVAFNTALKQMIWNVLDNAIEASPHWIRFEARCDGGILTLIVSDAGPGFSAEMLAQFGKPYQSSKERAGRGLGLFFVTNVARKLGGVVTAQNLHQDNVEAFENATGAVVRFTLPLDAIRLAEDTKVCQMDERRLLIIEDDLAFSRTLSRSFERRGYQVCIAENPEQASVLLKTYTPGFAVVDLKLHGHASGLTCVQMLHQHDPAMLIVVLTGFASINTAVEAIKLGACQYLAKPSNTDDIEAAFNHVAGTTKIDLTNRATSIKNLEWERIHEMLVATDYNISETARQLGMHRRLWRASLKTAH